MIVSHTYQALAEGPRLLVFGGIHGNETCGTEAINALMHELDAGTLKLAKGSVTFVPMCNPLAHAAGVRYVEKNLNRIFKIHTSPTCEEERFATVLARMVENCDVLLDLHSFHTPGVPFVFRDYNDPATCALSAALGVPHTLTGWPELYADKPELNGGDTVAWAHSLGKVATLVECGVHTAPAALALARQCMLGAMGHFGLLADVLPPAPPTQVVRFASVMTYHGGKLACDWQNLDVLPAGTVIGWHADGQPVVAEEGCFMVMPNPAPKIGDEWFYLGVAED